MFQKSQSAISWTSDSSEIFLNPRISNEKQEKLKRILLDSNWLKGHLWLTSSGSTATHLDQIKLIALSKEAVLRSAKAVNDHLNSNHLDIWINPLPIFHVGGLGIYARAWLSGAKHFIYQEKWDAVKFHNQIQETKATLTAVVPTQVFDIVNAELKAPITLRAVIVGGAALDKQLYNQAKLLGWNLLPSYGMTECCSQIATATLDNQDLKILPHMNVKIDEIGQICIKSNSLLSTYALETPNGFSYIDPKKEGWLHSSDLGTISNGYLTVQGRVGDFVKIGGEGVELIRLEQIMERIKLNQKISLETALIAYPDSRLGHLIHLVVEIDRKNEAVQSLVESFQSQVLPFERIRYIHGKIKIPRSPLGKLLKNELMVLIGELRLDQRLKL